MPTKEAITGNKAVSYGVKLSRAKVIPVYPITPQSSIIESLAGFIAEGQLEAYQVTSEGEHGMVATAIGAAFVGVRTFTATCSQGFAYAYENIAWVPGARLPIVLAVTNRSLAMPLNTGCDYSDSMSMRDHGWVQFYVENAQEALDTIIQAYRIAEDKRVLLPVMVCLDGFLVSHTTENVEIPDQENVDQFLPPYNPTHIIMDPDKPMEIVGSFDSLQGMGYEYLKDQTLTGAGEVIRQANLEFGEKFGRKYGNGLVEEVDTKDAEVILVTMGSMSGNAKLAVRELRKEGKRVGLIRLRCFRPFPKEELIELAMRSPVLAVVDRHVSKGTGEGACFAEVRSTLYNLEKRPKVIGFIAGLHGMDTPVSDFEYMANKALEVANRRKEVERAPEWVPNLEIDLKEPSPIKLEEPYYPGITTCPGCGMALVFRAVVDALGRDIVLVRTAGCQAWQSTVIGKSATSLSFARSTLPSGSACATGISLGLKAKGREDIETVLLTGDGCAADMGFLALSGAAERNEDFMVVVYDNEAYANTGIQRSGTTPFLAWTSTTPTSATQRGKGVSRKDLPLIVAAHRVPYVATASLAYPEDLCNKLKKARQMQGFRLIHVYTPCPTSWRHPAEKTIEMSRLGVETGVHVLYEIEKGKLKVTVKPKERKPVAEYIEKQGRFAHLTEAEKEMIQEEVNRAEERLLRWEESGLSLPFIAG